MDLKVKQGKRTIKLDAAERRALARAKELCSEIYKLDVGGVASIAGDAFEALGTILGKLSPAETDGNAEVIPAVSASDVKKAMQRDVPA